MSAGCSQSPGRDTACMLPLAAKSGLGTGDCDWRGLDRAGCDPEASGADPGCHAVKCLRWRQAASATWQLVPRQSLGLRARRPPHAQRARGEWSGRGAARTGLARSPTLPLMAAMMPLTLWAPGLRTCWPGVGWGGVQGPARSLLSSPPLPPSASSSLAGSNGFVQREKDRFRVLAFALG